MKITRCFYFLNKAKEVDAHINTDIDSLNELYKYVKGKFSYDIPIITVATQSDEMDPVLDKTPPYKEIKQTNINEAIDYLNKKVQIYFPKVHIKLLSAL